MSFDCLPPEIAVMIFEQLPLRSLSAAQCVSHTWHELGESTEPLRKCLQLDKIQCSLTREFIASECSISKLWPRIESLIKYINPMDGDVYAVNYWYGVRIESSEDVKLSISDSIVFFKAADRIVGKIRCFPLGKTEGIVMEVVRDIEMIRIYQHTRRSIIETVPNLSEQMMSIYYAYMKRASAAAIWIRYDK